VQQELAPAVAQAVGGAGQHRPRIYDAEMSNLKAYAVAIASLLAGASVVHAVAKPDKRIPVRGGGGAAAAAAGAPAGAAAK
jgi:hypothetical protein